MSALGYSFFFFCTGVTLSFLFCTGKRERNKEKTRRLHLRGYFESRRAEAKQNSLRSDTFCFSSPSCLSPLHAPPMMPESYSVTSYKLRATSYELRATSYECGFLVGADLRVRPGCRWRGGICGCRSHECRYVGAFVGVFGQTHRSAPTGMPVQKE